MAVVVVAAVVLAGLYAAGDLGKSSSSSTPSGPSFNVTFSETGLPASTSWSVTLGGSTMTESTSSIVFSEQNNTYSYSIGAVSGYAPTPASGSVTVNGGPISVPVSWKVQAPGTYAVTFTESGLTTGTSWSVTLNSVTTPGTGNTIVFEEKNGTYSFTAGSVTGYTPSPSSGSITVSGPGAAQTITYTSSGGGGGSAGQTYSQAAATAAPTTSSVAGGPWTLEGGSGVQLSQSFPVNQTLLNESFDFGCQPTVLPGASTITSFPATTSPSSSGKSALWVIVFGNKTGYALEVAVLSGVATPVLTLASFNSCDTSSGILNLPSDVLDSPTIASAAWTAGGMAYAANHTSYEVELIVLNVTSFGPTWVVSYTNCNPTESGATLDGKAAAQFTAVYYALNGTLHFKENSNTACPVLGGGSGGGKPTLTEDCFLYSVEDNETPTYYNNATLICSGITLTSGELTASIVNNTTGHAISTTGLSLEIYNTSSLTIVATYNFGTNTWSSTTVPIPGDEFANEFVLTSSRSMAGDNLVLTATLSAPATGSITTYLGAGE